MPAFAGGPPSEREYAERCVDYYAHQYRVSAALVRAVSRAAFELFRGNLAGVRSRCAAGKETRGEGFRLRCRTGRRI